MPNGGHIRCFCILMAMVLHDTAMIIMWKALVHILRPAFSISPHVNLEEREKHRAEIMSDPVWKETCKLYSCTCIDDTK